LPGEGNLAAREGEDVKYSPFKLFGQPKMAALLFLGFASGLPLLLTGRVLQAWMTEAKVDLATIGVFSLAALPYSLKFLWAPLLDRYVPPFLGRRRGWLLITQTLLMLAIGALAFRDPLRSLQLLAINAIVITFLSATQDIAADAYRTDVLEHNEMGAGAATFVLGYRLALLVAGALALFLAGHVPWTTVYLAMAAFMIVGIITTVLAPEPLLRDAPPRTLAEAVKLPFQEFFQRTGLWKGILVLAFIVLYKYPESLAQNMLTPFLLEIGFTTADLATAQGVVGLVATIVGSIAGGAIVGRIGINKSLWIFGAAQALSNLLYYMLALSGKNTTLLYVSVAGEYFAFGLVAAGLVAFLMSICSMRFSATQYALLSSLMAASRDILVAPGGRIAEATGWPMFFLITVIVGIPAIAPLPFFAPWSGDKPTIAAEHTGATIPAKATG
jgi:MFS transporter, PAT family, beta-lactamase induction signal transducer AmpG